MDLAPLQTELVTTTQAVEALLQIAGAPIESDAQYTSGVDLLKRVKGHTKELEEREKAIVRPLNESLKAIRDLFRKPKDILDRAESLLKSNMVTYQRAQEAKRIEEQRKADAAARQERERLERQAKAAEARGNTEAADTKRAMAETVVAPVIPIETPKIAGIATRKDYDFVIEDAAKLPRHLLMPDEKAIRKLVRAAGLNANIPGVRVVEKDVVAVRA